MKSPAQPRSPAVVIAYHRRSGIAGLNVITGAAAEHPAAAHIPQVFVRKPAELVERVGQALASGQRPLVAFSFYSSDFEQSAAAARELRATGWGSGIEQRSAAKRLLKWDRAWHL